MMEVLLKCEFPCGGENDFSVQMYCRATNSRRISNEYVKSVTSAKTTPSTVIAPNHFSTTRLKDIDLMESKISIEVFELTNEILDPILLLQLFSNDRNQLTDFVNAQVDILNEIRKSLKWYHDESEKSLDELTVIQPMFKYFVENLLASLVTTSVCLADTFSVEDGNIVPLEVEVILEDNADKLTDYNVEDERRATLQGRPDLVINIKNKSNGEERRSLVEKKPPYSRSRGLYHTKGFQSRDQFLLELHADAVAELGGVVRAGALSDFVAVVLGVCIIEEGGIVRHHQSKRVCDAVLYIKVILCLLCQLTPEFVETLILLPEK